jgi:hypothetical protein
MRRLTRARCDGAAAVLEPSVMWRAFVGRAGFWVFYRLGAGIHPTDSKAATQLTQGGQLPAHRLGAS